MSIGVLEVGSWTAALASLDAAEKAAPVRVLRVELNDLLGAIAQLEGDTAQIAAALSVAEAVARAMNATVVTTTLNRPHPQTSKTFPMAEEFNPLIEQNTVHLPREVSMAETNQAIGIIETQGFTAVIEAIDAATKAADVEVAGREKLGGGYIAVVLRGNVAAVRAAVDAGSARVGSLGKLIASHVIARPSPAVVSLLPKA